MKGPSAALILATCGVFFAGSHPPFADYHPPDGGTAAANDYRCPAGYVLIGIGGRQGSWMDAAWGICGRVRSDGTINSGDRRTTSRAGGSGGTSGAQVCPSGRALVGYTGNAGTYVNTIRTITCARWDSDRRVSTGSPYGYSLFPERSGGFYSQTYCAYGMVGDGIRGQAGIYLDSFSVRCVFAPTRIRPRPACPRPGEAPPGSSPPARRTSTGAASDARRGAPGALAAPRTRCRTRCRSDAPAATVGHIVTGAAVLPILSPADASCRVL